MVSKDNKIICKNSHLRALEYSKSKNVPNEDFFLSLEIL